MTFSVTPLIKIFKKILRSEHFLAEYFVILIERYESIFTQIFQGRDFSTLRDFTYFLLTQSGEKLKICNIFAILGLKIMRNGPNSKYKEQCIKNGITCLKT